jgi:transcriptional regulator with XRE-family HTH domain
MISRYERDEREPSLFALLAYARIAGVSVDVLIDDKLRLPR